jgi:hypothetical protein
MSLDIYAQFVKTISGNLRGCSPDQGGFQTLQIVLAAVTLVVKPVPMLDNFCFVGAVRSQTYDSLVRAKVDQAFEDIVLKDCERE